MILYHATYRANISSIKKLGLGAKQPKNWEFSVNGAICLATDPETAFSYAESADDVSDYKYNSGIIVLMVDTKTLNPSLLAIDPNIKSNTSYLYRGVIPPQNIAIITSKKHMEMLLSCRRIPAYE